MTSDRRTRPHRRHPAPEPGGARIPHNPEMEKAFLGALLLYGADRDTVAELLDEATSRLFYGPGEQALFETIARLHHSGQPVTAVMVKDQLTHADRQVVTDERLIDLLHVSANKATALGYRARLAQIATEREGQALAAQIVSDPTIDLTEAGERLKAIAANAQPNSGNEWGDYTLYDAVNADLPAQRHVIPGILPVGVTVLYAPPKARKSFLAQQVELHLGCGVPLMSKLEPPSTPVRCLVLDFEGSIYLTQDRTHMLSDFTEIEEGYHQVRVLHPSEIPTEADYLVKLAWLRGQLDTGIRDDWPYGYVRIDTATDFMGPRAKGENAYDAVKAKLTKLNALALEYGITILVVHHTNDGGGVNGSDAAWLGGSEANWKLEREHPDDEDPRRVFGTLTGNGRSLRGEFTLAMEFDDDGWRHTEDRIPAQIETTGVARIVVDLLAENGPCTVERLKSYPSLFDTPHGTVRKTLARLRTRGVVDHDPVTRRAEAGKRAGRGGQLPQVWQLVDKGPRIDADTTESVRFPTDSHSGPSPEPTPRSVSPAQGQRDKRDKRDQRDKRDERDAVSGGSPCTESDNGGAENANPQVTALVRSEETLSPGGNPDDSDLRGVAPGNDPHGHRLGTGREGSREPSPPPTKAMDALVRSLKRSSKRPLWRVLPDDRDEEPWSLDRAMFDSGHGWFADLDHHDTADKLVWVIDRRASFPSAMSSATVGAGALRRHGPIKPRDLVDLRASRTTRNPDGQGRAGIYLVELPDWDEASFGSPFGRRHAALDGPVWITDAHLDLIRRVGAEWPEIADAWLSNKATNLFRPFSEWARERRRSTAGTDQAEPAKKDINRAIQLIRSTAPSPIWRPDWSRAIRANARTAQWVKARAAHERYGHVIGMNAEDAIHVLVDADAQSPPGFKIGPDYGHMGITAVMTVETWADPAARQAAQKAGTYVRRTR